MKPNAQPHMLGVTASPVLTPALGHKVKSLGLISAEEKQNLVGKGAETGQEALRNASNWLPPLDIPATTEKDDSHDAQNAGKQASALSLEGLQQLPCWFLSTGQECAAPENTRESYEGIYCYCQLQLAELLVGEKLLNSALLGES